jgi:Tat protein secretion system quality control protein TatD with DNase activity
VPDDRLLLESDHNLVSEVDPGLEAMLGLVCEAKGWGREEAAQRTYANFADFFSGSLALMGGGSGE